MSLTNLGSKASLHQLTMLQGGEIKVCVTKTKVDSSNFISFGLGIKFLCQLGEFFVFLPPDKAQMWTSTGLTPSIAILPAKSRERVLF